MSSAASTPLPSPSEPFVSVRGLTKHFVVDRDVVGKPKSLLAAVDGVDLDIQRGEVLGLVGESGSGKSTLARLILRLLPATSGSVLFEGRDVLTASRKELRDFRQRAQIIFQDPFASLDPRMKVSSIVEEGMGHLGLSKSDRRRRVEELLSLVHLPTRALDRYAHEFSGGQRQRISIARALAVNPTFLIADEPVSALDVSVQSHILNLLQELRDELNLTYLFVTHDMSVVNHLADRIAVMYLGKLVEVASVEELFENPRHPYTQALLSSVPSLTRTGIDRRIILEGDIPTAVDPRAACRFAGRCFRVQEQCRNHLPELEKLPGARDHFVSCFNHASFTEVASELRAG